MRQITSFSIDSSDLTAASSTRDLTILGDAGSRFVLYLSNENPHYYDFSTDTFSATETKLHGEIPSGGKYVKKITFPTITDGDQYDFQLVANPSHGVELAEGLSLGNSVYYRTKILQKADIVLTFAVATTTSGDFQTMPTSVTLTKPPLSTGKNIVEISWTIKATDAASGGSLELVRQPVDTDFKFTITHDSTGAGSSGTTIYLDSVDNLTIGMSLTAIESGSVSGSPIISSIDKTGKSVVVSVKQSWATAKDISFKSGGTAKISSALNSTISFIDEKGVSALKAGLTELTATVNGAVSGANAITLDDAHGIRADGTAKLKGIGFDNRVIQYVTGINYAGKVIEVTGNQTLEDNTILTFSNCAIEAVITAKIIVSKMPNASAVLTLDLDSILTSSIT